MIRNEFTTDTYDKLFVISGYFHFTLQNLKKKGLFRYLEIINISFFYFKIVFYINNIYLTLISNSLKTF